jgi:carbonic anhydrase
MQAKLKNLQQYQSQAVSEQRSRKTALDTKLAELKNHTGPATKKSISLYDSSVAAYNDLKAAASQRVSSEANVAEVKTFADEAANSKWDQNAPSKAAVQTGSNTTKAAASLTEFSREQEQGTNCNALGQSPVDIDSKRVVDASSLSSALIEPLAFRYMSPSNNERQGARLRLSKRGRHLRVAVPPGSTEWPLGGVLSSGILRGVSYVDIHVPGEHSVDGHVPAAELQLVHESAGGKPAVAVAVPLELSSDSSSADYAGANEWLKPLLAALPEKKGAQEVLGEPLALLHKAFSSGATSDYYRYDGSLTKPPCLLTEWFVLQEPGHLSRRQLADLSAALGVDISSQGAKQRGPSFLTSLVMRGSPHLVSQVTSGSLTSKLSSAMRKFRGRRRLQV